jgi:hypothetical protein
MYAGFCSKVVCVCRVFVCIRTLGVCAVECITSCCRVPVAVELRCILERPSIVRFCKICACEILNFASVGLAPTSSLSSSKAGNGVHKTVIWGFYQPSQQHLWVCLQPCGKPQPSFIQAGSSAYQRFAETGDDQKI